MANAGASGSRSFSEKLEPFSSRRHRPWFIWYAYLHGHPGYDKPPFSGVSSMAYIDASIFMFFSGFFDYLIVSAASWATGTLWICLATSLVLRARLSGLWDFLADQDTSYGQATVAVMETAGAVYWHVLAKIVRHLPFRPSLALMIRIVGSTLPGGEVIADGPPCKNCTLLDVGVRTLKSTAIQLAGQYLPMVLILLFSLLTLLVQLAVALLNQYQVMTRIADLASDALDILQSSAVLAQGLVARAVRPLLGIAIGSALGLWRVTLSMMRLHIMAWLDDETANRLDDVLNAWISFLGKERTASLCSDRRAKANVFWWPPGQAVTTKNCLVFLNHIYYGACAFLQILYQHRGSTTSGPYRRLSGRQIRLLRLQPALLSGQDLFCQLMTHDLDKTPSYIGISYRWSQEWTNQKSATEPIVIIDGHKLRVGVGTYEALRGIRSRWRSRTIWVDAVCIDQENDQEKGDQVKMMSEIYSCASKVVVWLGEPPNAGLAIRMLRGLWVRMALVDPKFVTDAYEPRTPYQSWRALRELVRRPWFERCWIVQEVAVARSVELRYGSETLPWDALVSFTVQISAHPLQSHISTDASMTVKGVYEARNRFRIPWDFVGSLGMLASPTLLTAVLKVDSALIERARDEPTSTKGSFGVRHVFILQRLRLLRQAGRREQLAFYLRNLYCAHGRFLCSDPRDRIYALLSMCNEVDDPFFSPDYRKGVADLYRDVATYFYGRGVPFLAESGIGYIYNDERSKTCDCASHDSCADCIQAHSPSWVPNWHMTRYQAPLDMENYHGDLVKLSRQFDQNTDDPKITRFFATKETPFTCDLTRDTKLLCVSGARHLDTLRYCGTVYAPRYLQRMAGQISNDGKRPGGGHGWSRFAYDENLPVNGADGWYSLAMRHALNPYPAGDGSLVSIVEALWRTVIADAPATHIAHGPARRLQNGQSIGPHPGPVFLEYLRNLTRIQGGESFVKVLELDAGHEKIRRHQLFHMMVTSACIGRRFGITSQGYMGLFPMGSKEGDQIWLVNGLRIPMLFRPCETSADQKVVQNVGECYVHGMMYGEAWSAESRTQSIVVK